MEILKHLAFKVLVIISIVFIHELGHSLIANIFDCKSKAIIFDSNFNQPYSYIECKTSKYLFLITFAGFLFSVIFSFIYLVFGKEYFLFAISFSIFSSSEDLQFLFPYIYFINFSIFIFLQTYSEIIFLKKYCYGKNNKCSFW